ASSGRQRARAAARAQVVARAAAARRAARGAVAPLQLPRPRPGAHRRARALADLEARVRDPARAPELGRIARLPTRPGRHFLALAPARAGGARARGAAARRPGRGGRERTARPERLVRPLDGTAPGPL